VGGLLKDLTQTEASSSTHTLVFYNIFIECLFSAGKEDNIPALRSLKLRSQDAYNSTKMVTS